jgi:hypothetical protein
MNTRSRFKPAAMLAGAAFLSAYSLSSLAIDGLSPGERADMHEHMSHESNGGSREHSGGGGGGHESRGADRHESSGTTATSGDASKAEDTKSPQITESTGNHIVDGGAVLGDSKVNKEQGTETGTFGRGQMEGVLDEIDKQGKPAEPAKKNN